MCEPECLGKTDLLLGGVVRKLGTVDIHILEVKLRKTTFLGQGNAGFAQGKVEMDAGIIDLIPGIQRPYAVDRAREISRMTYTRRPAGR